jgi:magnesium-transporting ATPase (P-type)
LIYSLCFYRARITWGRIIVAKLLTNIQNVFLGSLWSAILYSKGYLYYLGSSAVKNTLYLPLQIILLFLLFRALLPVLYKMKWLPKQMGKAMAKKVEKEEKRTFDPER